MARTVILQREHFAAMPSEHFPAKWNPIGVTKMLLLNELRVFYSQNRCPLLRNTR